MACGQGLGCELKPIFHCNAKLLPNTKFRVGGIVQRESPTRNFALGIPTCWYSKMPKFALSPMQTLKFALPPTRNPNASQWNVGCVGSPGFGACIGLVHFMLFVSISFALGSQREHSFQSNMGFKHQVLM